MSFFSGANDVRVNIRRWIRCTSWSEYITIWIYNAENINKPSSAVIISGLSAAECDVWWIKWHHVAVPMGFLTVLIRTLRLFFMLTSFFFSLLALLMWSLIYNPVRSSTENLLWRRCAIFFFGSFFVLMPSAITPRVSMRQVRLVIIPERPLSTN